MYFAFKLVLILFAILLGMLFLAFLFTQWQARQISLRYPNTGELIDVGGFRMNSVHVPKPATADLPPLVFIHGASGNLRDPMVAFRDSSGAAPRCCFSTGRPRLFRTRRTGNCLPDGQADAIASADRKRGIRKAIIVSHSFGGAITASFALNHKEMVAGLVFLAPATHPWPGGIEWYYDARQGALSRLALFRVDRPVARPCVDRPDNPRGLFQPNPVLMTMSARSKAPGAQARRLSQQCAIDIANLFEYVKRVSPRYREIKAPTVIITGDSDGIVLRKHPFAAAARGHRRFAPGPDPQVSATSRTTSSPTW